MSFIEAHLVEPERAKPLVAMQEAFSALKNGGYYTLKIVLILGSILGILFWIPERFSVSSTSLATGQTLLEAIFAFYWHRFFLLGEAKLFLLSEAKTPSKDFIPFMKRSLFYYVALVIVVIVSVFVFIGTVGSLSDLATIGLIASNLVLE